MASALADGRRCVVCGSTHLTRHWALASYELMACRDCDVRFKSSLWSMGTAELEAVYQSPRYWESYANRQDGGVNYEEKHPRVGLYRRDLATLEGLSNGPGRLLDVGCARGVFLDLARRAGWTVSGVELSTLAAQYAREQFGLDVFEGRLENAPWPHGSFDAVTLFDVIEHLADPNAMLAGISRLLRPGGCLLLATPNARSLLHRLSVFFYRASLHAIQRPVAMVYGRGKGGHVLFFDRRALAHLLARHNLGETRFSLDAVDQGLWAPLKTRWLHWGLSAFDRCVSGPLRAKYRIVLYARRLGT